MRTQLALLFVACAMVAGCRSNPEHQLLERELRLQEDKIYHLQAMLEDCHAMLDSSRRENESLKREVSTGDRAAGAEPLPPGSTGPLRSILPPPRSGRPSTSEPSGPAFAPPTIELPENPDSSIPVPPAPDTSSGSQGEALPSPVTQIILDSRLTGGRNVDGRPGDDGVLVAFQPQDAKGKLVQTPGDVSVVILDPSKQGAEARVARWDFSSDEVSRKFRKSLLGGRNLQFDLPWPSAPPTNSRLHLFVRYVTADGQKLIAERLIDVDPPVRRAGGWTRVTNAPPRTESAHHVVTAAAESQAANPQQPATAVKTVQAAVIAEATETEVEQPQAPVTAAKPSQTVKPAIKTATKPVESPRPTWSPYR